MIEVIQYLAIIGIIYATFCLIGIIFFKIQRYRKKRYAEELRKIKLMNYRGGSFNKINNKLK